MKKTPSVKNLEKKYKDRGLKFNNGYFSRSHPTQAEGVIDGLMFYFRFRHNFASIEIGKPFIYKGKVVESGLPHYVSYYATKDNVTNDEHAGELTYAQEEEVFIYLMENIEDNIETPEQAKSREEWEAQIIDDIENPKPSFDWEKELLGHFIQVKFGKN